MNPAALHVRVSRLVLHGTHALAPKPDAGELGRLIAERLAGATTLAPGNDALSASIAQAVALAVMPRFEQAQVRSPSAAGGRRS